MENASKALLMAAGVLIGVMILSLAVYLFVSFSDSTRDMQKQMEESAIENFNNQFFAYDGHQDLTIYDVYTVVNMARDNNEKYDLTGEGIKDYNFYIAVFFDSASGSKGLEAQRDFAPNSDFDDTRKMTKETDPYNNEVMSLSKYKCSVYVNENTNRVNTIVFTQI